jgi:enoyl-CoA hydratase/carnithine racemase
VANWLNPALPEHCVTDSDDSPLLLKLEPPVAWLTVNRPAAHNALNLVVWRQLTERLRELGGAADLRVIVVRGAGDKAFISGADITEFDAQRGDASSADEYDEISGHAWAALEAAPQPVIAMVNGLCYGGGVSVALACDLRLAADTARFAIPAVRLGLSYPRRAVERLVDIVGAAQASRILLSGESLDAGEALRIGLVHRIVAAADLEAATRRYALSLAEGAPLTMAAHKLLIRDALQGREAGDPALARQAIRRCFASADYREGVAAFLAKRKPRFSGS